MGESQSRSVMLHHQDQPLNSAYERKEGSGRGPSSSLQNRKGDKDSNFNFLPGKDGDSIIMMGNRGDENRNQVRPHNLGPLGRDLATCSPTTGFHHSTGILSPRSRLPCWSPLEPLPEIDSGDDGYGRVPPDGAEEGRVEDEEGGRLKMMTMSEQKQRERDEVVQRRRKGSIIGGEEEEEEEAGLEDDDEWGDSDSESEHSQSGGSMSSLNTESGGEGVPKGGWDHIGVGEPESKLQESDPTRKWVNSNPEPTGRSRSISQKCLTGRGLENCILEEQSGDGGEQSSDSDGEPPEIMDGVWTLRDRERFKAQEMEKHQVQLTMYRRLALIRWVRTLQGRVQEQQNRLQSSFDVILTHRKELLRMGTAAAVANVAPTAAVSQS